MDFNKTNVNETTCCEPNRMPAVDDSDSDDEFYDALAVEDTANHGGRTPQFTTGENDFPIQNIETVNDLPNNSTVNDTHVEQTEQTPDADSFTGTPTSFGRHADNFVKDTKAEVLSKLRLQDSSCSESEDEEIEQLKVGQDDEMSREENEAETTTDGKAEDVYEDNGGYVTDEEGMKEREEQMTEEEKLSYRQEGQDHKTRGNELFKTGDFVEAVRAYSQALQVCPLCHKKDRSIMYANRAACKVKEERYESAITDCTKALELNPVYLKVILRRAKTYELTEKLEDALKDYEKVVELDGGCYEARAACMRLPEQIKERNEKLKTEMMSKLKELGNLCLRPFGLSTNNFQLNQDPNTGSYSVNFSQNPAATTGGDNGK